MLEIEKDKAIKEQEQREYDTTYNQAVKDDESGRPSTIYAEYMNPIGIKLDSLFKKAEGDRVAQDGEHLKSLRQFKGEYDPDVKSRMHPKRSKAFISITRTKTKTQTARMTDILFPANGDKNWGVAITPIPDMSPDLVKRIAEQIQITSTTQQPPTEDHIKKTINDEARRRCSNMEREMEDQLSEIKYRDVIRKVIFSGNLYGTGILKGPLIKEVVSKRWVADAEGNWVTVELRKLMPYCEFVPLWDVYPDMSAREPEDMRYIFQRYSMTRNKVYALSKRSDFNTDAIEAYLTAFPEGDSTNKTHEENLRSLAKGAESSGSTVYNGKYEVKEFWGYLSAQEMKDLGVNIPEEKLGLEFAANIWMLGPIIIKAILSPIEGVSFPYFFYYYQKDETSIYGEGVPTIMRHNQILYNAAVRAMLDNAAISAGPIVEANLDLLAAGEDPTDLYPFRVFQRSGSGIEATQKAVTVTTLPSYTKELMGLATFFADGADETTMIPKYLYGESANIKGAGKTATGLSMLMGASNVAQKDQIKNFDDGVTRLFIRALYFWNMDFNPKEDIKGDFSIQAKGSTSLIAKELLAEQLNNFLVLTNNEVDLQLTKRDNVLRKLAEVLDLDELDLIKSSDEVAILQQQNDERNAKMQKFEMDLAVLKATSGGHVNGQGSPPGAETPGIGRPTIEQLPADQLETGVVPEVQVA